MTFPSRKCTGLSRRSYRKVTKPKSKKQISKLVKQIVSKEAETKFFYSTYGPTGIDYSGTIVDISAIPQGSTDNSRNGDTLRYKNLYISGNIVAGDATNLLRMIIFRWKPNVGTSVGSVLTASTLGTALAPHSRYYHDFLPQMRIIYDKLITVNAVSKPQVAFKCVLTKGIKDVKAQFSAGSTNATNRLYVLLLSDSAAIPNPTVAFAVSIQFQDV